MTEMQQQNPTFMVKVYLDEDVVTFNRSNVAPMDDGFMMIIAENGERNIFPPDSFYRIQMIPHQLQLI